MEREHGYYWVRFHPYFHGQWVIAFYHPNPHPRGYIDLILKDEKHREYIRCCEWGIGDWRYPYTDVIEIDERKIVRNIKNLNTDAE